MNDGFVLERGGGIPVLPEIATEAEAAGWDGLFTADGRIMQGRMILVARRPQVRSLR